MAFKYLSWALFPLLGGYAIYSLVYDEQKGWYNWILWVFFLKFQIFFNLNRGMLYGFLLTFGFIMVKKKYIIKRKNKIQILDDTSALY